MKRNLLIIFVFLYLPVFSQVTLFKNLFNDNVNLKLDTNFCKAYKPKFLLMPVITRKFQHIKGNLGNKSFQYTPNNPYNAGLCVAYGWFSVDLAINVPNTVNDYKSKGKSTIFRARVGYNNPKFWFSTFGQYFKGCYMKTTDFYDTDWFINNNDYPYLSDIENITWYSSLYYSFNNEKITYQSTMGMEHAQKKSAGTFLAGLSSVVNVLQSDSLIFPEQQDEKYYLLKSFETKEDYTLGVNFGYVHTFRLPANMFLTLSLLPGLHYRYGSYEYKNMKKDKFSIFPGSLSEARAVLGYTTDKYYGCAALTLLNSWGFDDMINTNGYSHFKVVFGKRLF